MCITVYINGFIKKLVNPSESKDFKMKAGGSGKT